MRILSCIAYVYTQLNWIRIKLCNEKKPQCGFKKQGISPVIDRVFGEPDELVEFNPLTAVGQEESGKCSEHLMAAVIDKKQFCYRIPVVAGRQGR